MIYQPSSERYEKMDYNRCGKTGLKLPAISLGLWHNFGSVDNFDNARKMILFSFDNGITHFDLANNYGPEPGSAEENFGLIFKKDLVPFRDELIVSTKAGYTMWDGPYGDWGSRKYLIASLDQSLKRMGVEYVDIFYSHRFDPETPLEETMSALDFAVRSGRALYAGISNYPAEQTRQAAKILKDLGTPCIIHQAKYSMFNRWIEDELLQVLNENGMGCIAFSPLAQGMLTDRYINGIPKDSRAAKSTGFLKADMLTTTVVEKVVALSKIAGNRGQVTAQLALSWVLRDPTVTSVLIGASKTEQIAECIEAKNKIVFTADELQQIEVILNS